jgi:hypothetical protein
MKKLICVLLVVVMMATLLTACGKFKCELCGEEKSGKKHEGEVLGEKVVYCDECYKELEELKGALS